jgi:hypothetical protein
MWTLRQSSQRQAHDDFQDAKRQARPAMIPTEQIERTARVLDRFVLTFFSGNRLIAGLGRSGVAQHGASEVEAEAGSAVYIASFTPYGFANNSERHPGIQ